MVRLNLRPSSLYGRKVAGALHACLPALNQRCSCAVNESCSVEINELPGKRLEVVVTRPRAVVEDHVWTPIAAVSGMYRLAFDKQESVETISTAIEQIVGAAIEDKCRSTAPSVSVPENLNIVLVDELTLRNALKLVGGCCRCSLLSEIPFSCILDKVTGFDPAFTTYIVAEGSAKCPRCARNVRENTLVELQPLKADRFKPRASSSAAT